MKDVNVSIIVLSDNARLIDIPKQSQIFYKNQFSNHDEIVVNKNENKYVIIYKEYEFIMLDNKIFGNNIIQLFVDKIPDTNFILEMYYYPIKTYSLDCIKHILAMNEYFWHEFADEENSESFEYNITRNIESLNDNYDEYNNTFDFNEFEADCCEEEDDDDEGEDIDEILHQSKNKNKKTKDNNKKYKSSYIFRSANKVGKNIKRHGIIICSDKEAREKDERTIKDFLKIFIPGDSDKARLCRKILTRKWINSLVISKKIARKVKKAYKTYNRNDRKNTIKDRSAEFADKLVKNFDPFQSSNK
jgi:hypothetical protein